VPFVAAVSSEKNALSVERLIDVDAPGSVTRRIRADPEAALNREEAHGGVGECYGGSGDRCRSTHSD